MVLDVEFCSLPLHFFFFLSKEDFCFALLHSVVLIVDNFCFILVRLYRMKQDLRDKLWGAIDLAGRIIFVKQLVSSDSSFRSYAPLFEAYRARTCTQPVHFESVYVYVYNAEPSDDAFSSSPTLRLSITLAIACNTPLQVDVFDLRDQRDRST
jgi:hypothetical protein